MQHFQKFEQKGTLEMFVGFNFLVSNAVDKTMYIKTNLLFQSLA